MDNEMIAVAAVQKAIASTEYLEPYINSKDREPSWDGAVYVYRHAASRHAKDDLAGRVSVQVKGELIKKPDHNKARFQVDVSDLRNYLNDGGTRFFLVCFDKDNVTEKIYYKKLLPFDLKQILNGITSEKSKSIRLKPFPTDRKEKSDIFLNFVDDCIKQRACIKTEIIDLEELVKDKKDVTLSFGYTTVDSNGTNPFDYLFSHDSYIYLKTKYGVLLPVDRIDNVTSIGIGMPHTITIDEKLYYGNCELLYMPDRTQALAFGKSFKIVFRLDGKQQTFCFSLSGSLSERIFDIDFLVSAVKRNGFFVNGNFFDFLEASSSTTSKFDIDKLETTLKNLCRAKQALDFLDVQEELNMDIMKEQDFSNLAELTSAILDNHPVSFDNIEGSFGICRIGNLKILMSTIPDKVSGLYQIHNFFDTPLKIGAKNKDGEIVRVPSCVILSKQTLFECCNISNEHILQQLQGFEFSDVSFTYILNFFLKILLVYDANPKAKNSFLQLAEKIILILKSHDSSTPEYIEINELQVIKRMRALNYSEKRTLIKIIDDSSKRDDIDDILVGAYLLLGEQEEAVTHFAKLSKKKQEEFRKYPIFKFWTQSEEITNGKDEDGNAGLDGFERGEN